METTSSKIRSERDDFLAFSLAAADVLIAVNDTGRIDSVVGAANALLKGKPEDLTGKPIPDIFDGPEAPFVSHLVDHARQYGRIDPAVIYLGDDGKDKTPANVGMVYMPERHRLYLSLTVLPKLVIDSLPKRDSVSGLLERGQFQQIAAGGISPDAPGAGMAMLRELRLIRLQGLPTVLERMPTQKARTVMGEIGAFLRAQAGGEGLAAQLEGDEFAVVSKPVDLTDATKALCDHISDVLRRSGSAPDAIKPVQQRVAIDAAQTPADAAKALAYAISEFGKSDGLQLTSLSACLSEVVEKTVGKVNRVRSVIEDKAFTLAYQPIVDMLTRDVHHYEALTRFGQGQSPFETISFSEKVGLSCDLDMAVLDMALNNMRDHPGQHIAVNVSGCSLENDGFRSRFLRLLATHKAYAGKLMVELTESTMVEDMESVAAFLADLRTRGHALCLDDFGAGANAYNYLRRFEADYVKIDGPFLKAAVAEPRQGALLKSVALLCHELKVPMIAEMIETEALGQSAVSLGVQYGQGYLYGKPQARLVESSGNVRRTGAQETWQ